MKLLKKYIDNYYGESVELKYRMFCICATLGTITSFLGYILCVIIAGFSSPVGIGTLAAFSLMLSLTIYGVKTKRFEMTAILMSIFLNVFIFPKFFLVTGGLYSVAPMFFIMGIIIVVPLTEGYKRTFLFLFEFIEYIIIIALCYFFPEISFIRDQGIHTTMLLFSFIIVAFYVFSSTWMVVRHYDLERIKTDNLNSQLQDQALRDPLTHLYNRRYLKNFLENRFVNTNNKFAIALLDIDDFKKINDTYGHVFGDEMLVKLSELMDQRMHGKGFAARYGGEEFILYYDSYDSLGFYETLNGIKDDFREYYNKEKEITVSFSAGIACFNKEVEVKELYDKADALLYKAKREEKNKICY